MLLGRITFASRCITGLIGAALVACGVVGCSGTAVAPVARERLFATREWPLSQGSVLTTALRERVIDEETSLGSVFVRHTRSAGDQKPIEKLEMRFANPGDPPDWIEFQVATQPADAAAGGVQTFEFPFSAPLPHTFDFRVTVDGKAEELPGWRVEGE